MYCDKLLLIFLAVQAGIANNAAVISLPTMGTPNATVTAIQIKYKVLFSLRLTPLVCAKSLEILANTILE